MIIQQILLVRNAYRTVWIICILMLGCKGLYNLHIFFSLTFFGSRAGLRQKSGTARSLTHLHRLVLSTCYLFPVLTV